MDVSQYPMDEMLIVWALICLKLFATEAELVGGKHPSLIRNTLPVTQKAST